jgi:predicted Zn-dependent protease
VPIQELPTPNREEPINFNSVSTESGVSKAYLYTHPDIRDRIETLRKQQEGLPSPKQVKREMTDASKDVVIAAKNKRIKELEEENRLLKQELQKARGKMYDSLA